MANNDRKNEKAARPKVELVVTALRDVMKTFFGGNQGRMAGELGINPSHMSKVMRGYKPVTDTLLAKVREKTGVAITRTGHVVDLDVVAVPAAAPSPKVDGVLAVVKAMNAMTEEDTRRLDALISFRTRGEQVSIRGFISAIQDIIIIQDILDGV